MSFEVWWLLILPLFFALGWLAARIDITHILSSTRSLPAQYFKGLNYLLNEQTDRAVEVYVDVAKSHSETVELQFTLGHLFRNKGEIERAIRMHQKLLSRLDLNDYQKQMAQFELALDFLRAGLLDRAEELLLQLQEGDFERTAKNHLLEIYQQEKEWQKAIVIAQALRDTSHTFQHEIAEFYCELANQALIKSQPEVAREYLHRALAEHRKCARANLILGDLEFLAGNVQAAIVTWQKIEQQDYLYLGMVANRLLEAYDQSGQADAGTALLRGYLATYPDIDMKEIIFERLRSTEGPAAAGEFLREQLRSNSDMLLLPLLLENEADNAEGERKTDLERMSSLVRDNTRTLVMYHCNHCGFKARQYFWQCPACNEWESFLPSRGKADKTYLSGM